MGGVNIRLPEPTESPNAPFCSEVGDAAAAAALASNRGRLAREGEGEPLLLLLPYPLLCCSGEGCLFSSSARCISASSERNCASARAAAGRRDPRRVCVPTAGAPSVAEPFRGDAAAAAAPPAGAAAAAAADMIVSAAPVGDASAVWNNLTGTWTLPCPAGEGVGNACALALGVDKWRRKMDLKGLATGVGVGGMKEAGV